MPDLKILLNAFLPGKVFKLFKILFVLIFIILPVFFAYSEDSESIDNIQKNMQPYLDNPADIETVLEVCREAVRKKIPLEFISPRINEGLSKKVSVSEIAEVVRKEIGSFSKASVIINEIEGAGKYVSEDKLWQRTATLITSSVPEESIKKLIFLNIERTDRFIHVTGLYLSLLKWGLSSDSALLVSEAALKSNLRIEEYRDIASLFSKGRRSRISPEKLLKRITDELPNSKSLRQLEKRVLK